MGPGRPRHSAAARDELVRVLTRYQDAAGTPITIFFDGSGAPPGVPKKNLPRRLRSFFRAGQTADDMMNAPRIAQTLR